MKKQEVFDYMKEHKKEILIGAITTVGGVVLCALGVKAYKTVKFNFTIPGTKITQFDLNPDFGKFEWGSLYNGATECAISDMSLSDLGKLGEELMKAPNVTEDTKVWALVSMSKR